MKKTILITGGAGFIGSNLTRRLLKAGLYNIISIDNFDEFYAKSIKVNNLNDFITDPNFTFIEGDILDENVFNGITTSIDVIVHLAAKAGVRPSILNPFDYFRVNEEGTLRLLEYAKINTISQFIFASSSSVYGVNENVPWVETENLLPISPYASTKLSSEMAGHVYSSLYPINFIALRFFTVYGPGQRPDLAIHKFFDLIEKEQSIPVFGVGDTYRDYTYIDDITEGIERAINLENIKFEIINLGNSNLVQLSALIKEIETVCKKQAKIKYLDPQPGDVPITYADTDKSKRLLNFQPKTALNDGLNKFYQWYKEVNKMVDERI